MDVSFFGVSIEGPPPLGRIDMPLEVGTSVLYGMNGAGKSAVLRSLRAAFIGIAPEGGRVRLHFRIHDPQGIAWPATPFLRALFDTISADFRSRWVEREVAFWEGMQQGTIDPAQLAEDDDQYFLHLLENRANFDKLIVERVAFDLRGHLDSWQPLVAEIASQHLFTLTPVGRDQPLWNLSLSAQEHERTPTLTRLLQLNRERAAAMEQLRAGRAAAMQYLSGRKLSVQAHLLELPELESPPFFVSGAPGEDNDGPAWVPIPLLQCGELSAPDVLPLVLDESTSADQLSLDAIRFNPQGQRRRIVMRADSNSLVFSEKITEMLPRLSRRASRIAASLLLDSPKLRCQIRHPDDWLHQPAISWTALDVPSGTWVPLSALSQAQKRWSELAVRVALAEESEVGVAGLVLIDEPEAALHARAEQYMKEGLKKLATRLEAPVVVATHSAELLNDLNVRLYHVARGKRGRTTVSVMESPVRLELGAEPLGLRPADLLQLYRVFLLVEGAHDEALLGELIGDTLSKFRTWVVSIRGARKMNSALDARLILDFTDAALVVAIDNQDNRVLTRAWTQARTLAGQGKVDKAVQALKPIARYGGSEAPLVYEFARRAIESEQVQRFRLFGFAKRDIIEYLNVKQFIPGADSWGSLVREWDRRVPFKTWLKKVKGADVTPRGIARAASQMDHIPDEFVALGSLCGDASRSAPSR